MQRRFLSLVGTMILAVSGAASAFSQTPTAMVDRARKDLQNIIDAKKDQPNAAHQSALVSLMQVRQSLGAGNEDFAVQQIDSLVTLPGIPEDIRGAIEAIGQRIRTERADRVTAYNTDVDAACQRAAAAVSQAKEPKDLDATLRDLARMSDRPVITRTGENGSGRVPKLQTATSFVTRWQDYLQAKGHSSDNNLSSMLRTLADGNTPPLIPRSEILALMPPPDAEAEPPARFRRPTPTSTPTPMPTAQVDAAATEIMRGVKKLDDVAPAITQLVELRKEAGPYNNAGSDSTLGAALNGLQALQRTALETENGMTSGYGFGLSRSEYPSHPESRDLLAAATGATRQAGGLASGCSPFRREISGWRTARHLPATAYRVGKQTPGLGGGRARAGILPHVDWVGVPPRSSTMPTRNSPRFRPSWPPSTWNRPHSTRKRLRRISTPYAVVRKIYPPP